MMSSTLSKLNPAFFSGTVVEIYRIIEVSDNYKIWSLVSDIFYHKYIDSIMKEKNMTIIHLGYLLEKMMGLLEKLFGIKIKDEDMDNSLILTIIDLIGKSKTNTLIEKGFLNESLNLSQEDIQKCISKYKEIDENFEVPSLDKIKTTIENSINTLSESYKLGIKSTNIFNDDFPTKLKNIKDRSLLIFIKEI